MATVGLANLLGTAGRLSPHVLAAVTAAVAAGATRQVAAAVTAAAIRALQSQEDSCTLTEVDAPGGCLARVEGVRPGSH